MSAQNYLIYEFTFDDMEEMESSGYSIEEPKHFQFVKEYGERLGHAKTEEEAEEISIRRKDSFIWNGEYWSN